MLNPDFKEFVQLLNKNDVCYPVVGGYAVGIHGHPRYTGFNECYPNRKVVTLDGLPINFIGYNDLIKNKKASGRHQDLGDVENLQD